MFTNPANSVFNFALKAALPENITAQLTNRAGNTVPSKQLTVSNTANRATMSVSSLPNGIYYLVLTDKEGRLISKRQVNVQH